MDRIPLESQYSLGPDPLWRVTDPAPGGTNLPKHSCLEDSSNPKDIDLDSDVFN